MNYWVRTGDGNNLGPFDDYEAAYFAATINLGLEGWVIVRA